MGEVITHELWGVYLEVSILYNKVRWEKMHGPGRDMVRLATLGNGPEIERTWLVHGGLCMEMVAWWPKDFLETSELN